MTASRLQQLLRYLRDDPNDPFMNYAVGLEYISRKRYKQGIGMFQKIIRTNHAFVPAYHQLGLLLLQVNKRHEAIEILQQGIRVAGQVGEQTERAEMEDILLDLRRPRRSLMDRNLR